MLGEFFLQEKTKKQKGFRGNLVFMMNLERFDFLLVTFIKKEGEAKLRKTRIWC
ncbi:hypothetical protein LEP1GSC032_1512 [Leptospira interrogans str. 2002000631]|uniref:Uncharacterized protein n=1 Tax=Leptospira interrogans str. UI 12621 TaxID=1049937 RepID=A0A0F6HG45_LEPIR|nr:hypothetical protein LEP1GSC027_1679 [Leptospira interrogans str. 2002000624]EKO27349.1 hypothetical protein LEP1GSC104_1920 [Leptospira interrogans str. UI 12621]EKO88374.1 hypothetical protein LEP1GSC009_1491 [Leptospira interrogans serovar Grippotyphosa str. Andaman]EKQ50106.1 hypothetical protein LEP1GSC026_1376 [Leptospira interrogans str. 2002000623]EKR46907.1 hypothetical protein LEP1GSC097_2978 [Leptospira interrogans serovar Grippotyphosa str. UI 08368]EMJ79225.1 hypothetical prote